MQVYMIYVTCQEDTVQDNEFEADQEIQEDNELEPDQEIQEDKL
jgi:hypothetical protein